MWTNILLPLGIIARFVQSVGQWQDNIYDILADTKKQDLTYNILDYLDTSPDQIPTSNNFIKEPFNLTDVDSSWHRALPWNGTWVSNTEYIYQNNDGLQITSAATGQSRTLVPETFMLGIGKYELSPDQTQVLLMTKEVKLTHHMIAVVYNVRSGSVTPLQPDLGAKDATLARLPVTFATWAPKGSGIVYVYNNNIYYRLIPQSPDVLITTTGVANTVFNGVADWVYQEEVLSTTKAIWFSPDGTKLAWVQFNDTNVDLMPMTTYNEPGTIESQYPTITQLRYPKPGRPNPIVEVFVVQLPISEKEAESIKELDIIRLAEPEEFRNQERILFGAEWATNDELAITWENRVQNRAIISVCNVYLGKCQDTLKVTEDKGWLDLDDPPIFTKNGRRFAMALSVNNYTHVNVIDRDTNQRLPLTYGKIVVTKLYHWDEENHFIYFQGTFASLPGQRHLLLVRDFDSVSPGEMTCITCGLRNTRGNLCLDNTFQFSAGDRSYYVVSCNGPDVPQDFLFRSPNQRLAVLNDNDKVSAALTKKLLPRRINLDVPIEGKWRQYTAKVRLYLPPDFDENKKYPLVVFTYAGPTYQLARELYSLDFNTYLTSSHQIIHAIIDGRGCGGQGDEMAMEVYKDLGGPETRDQIEVTRKLIDANPFLDADKVAIWGWSYGGFNTLSVLANDPYGIFKCGMAVAPISNWIYYDSIYTERYMGLPTPEDNLSGYKKSDLTSKAANLKGKKLLLAHGIADDNVHHQNTITMVQALEKGDVLFQNLLYPDQGHGMGRLRPHLYHSLANFVLNDCFGKNITYI